MFKFQERENGRTFLILNAHIMAWVNEMINGTSCCILSRFGNKAKFHRSTSNIPGGELDDIPHP